jgi:hypothetical protein
VYIGDIIDSDPADTTASDFTATINWVDKSANTAGIVKYNSATKHFDVYGTHAYSVKGKYTLVVSIIGPGGSMATFDTMAQFT